VLKGTAAASIGAIAAAHGATSVDAAAAAGCGYGNLAGGVVGAFYKERDSFQLAVKFHKVAAEIFIKEALGGGVDIFWKLFDKAWVEGRPQTLSDSFPNLTDASLNFVKIDTQSAEFLLKYGDKTMVGSLDVSTAKIFLKVEEIGDEGPEELPGPILIDVKKNG
jgi:hypothetical protein